MMLLNPTTDLSALGEQLCRVEHKIDLIVEYLAKKDGAFELRKISDKKNTDPLTQEQVTYVMDLLKRHVVRRTADGTGLLPPSSVLFNQPNSSTGNTNGGENGSGID